MTIGDYQFELEGVPFGIGTSKITVENFDPGSGEWSIQDVDMQGRPATAFGRDILRGPTWAFELSTNLDTPEAALDAASELATVWRSLAAVSTPGRVLTLRYGLPGRLRRIYGRPRRWAATPTNRLIGGYLPISCDFKAADPLHYADSESSVVIGTTATSEGGFVFPVTFPAVTLPATERSGQVFGQGDEDTYPIIRIDGPIVSPWVRHNDWRIDLGLSLGVGDYVEVDTRPWALTVMKNGTSSVANKLGRRNKLGRMRIKPGAQEITFGGSSASGAATCTVRWRDAWNSL